MSKAKPTRSPYFVHVGVLLIAVVLCGCGGLSLISLPENHLNPNESVSLVSFPHDNPEFLLNGVPVDKRIPDEPPQPPDFLTTEMSDSLKFKTYYKALPLNAQLIHYFIIHCKQRANSLNIQGKLDVSQTKLAKIPTENPLDIDRDFTPIRQALSSKVIELRILHIDVNNTVTNKEQGLLNTYGAVLKVQGFMFDLETNQKVWESRIMYSSSDLNTSVVPLLTGSWLLSSLGKDDGKTLQRGYTRIINFCAKKLVDSLLENQTLKGP